MNKSAKYFILTELVLGILVAVLAALMLKGQNKDTLGRVAVIVRDSDDSQWSAFKYGIRMAAQERGVEAVIIGTESVLTLEDQEELIQAELENGADAVIVQPVPDEGAAQMLAKVRKKVPVMLVADQAPADGKASALPVTEPDPRALGTALAEELLEDFRGNLKGKTMGIISRTTDSNTTAGRMEGFQETLEGTGIELLWCIAGNFDNGESEYLASQPKVDFIAALGVRACACASVGYDCPGDGFPFTCHAASYDVACMTCRMSCHQQDKCGNQIFQFLHDDIVFSGYAI